MTKKFFSAAMLFAVVFVMIACSSDGSREVIGAWKTVDDSIFGKPDTLLIDEKKLVDNVAVSFDIAFKKENGKILIFSTNKEASGLLYTVTVVDKNTLKFHDNWHGERTFVRTTPEELQHIADTLGNITPILSRRG